MTEALQKKNSTQDLLDMIRFKSNEISLKKQLRIKKKMMGEDQEHSDFYKERDPLRFPSILNEKRRYDRDIFVEEPKFNSIMSRNFKYLNNDSTLGTVHNLDLTTDEFQFKIPRYRSINFNKGDLAKKNKIGNISAILQEIKDKSPNGGRNIYNNEYQSSQVLKQQRQNQSFLDQLKDSRKQKFNEMMDTMRSQTQLLQNATLSNSTININEEKKANYYTQNLKEEEQTSKQQNDQSNSLCTPALIDLYKRDSTTKSQYLVTKNKQVLINGNLSRQKNTFNSIFPSTLIFKTRESPRPEKHFITSNEEKTQKTLEIMKSNPDCGPRSTDIENGMYFKRNDDIVKQKNITIKMHKAIIRSPTPKTINKSVASKALLKK
ncbi:UNKNOWN [Stylonychia lemnae]|uniref:Uncharacterized protein n=1 Tax=Stylonychia lemnae TaxID=5949 RepID=A0A077ZXH4_STYLE|nr:UNKNOWN [Stylonychia lemnae]|eukprot:CDW74611.1 UNKNOWN [Stylonychia lemnae]